MHGRLLPPPAPAEAAPARSQRRGPLLSGATQDDCPRGGRLEGLLRSEFPIPSELGRAALARAR
eukprot:10327923-Alexandrium_andersonii.AAC.1